MSDVRCQRPRPRTASASENSDRDRTSVSVRDSDSDRNSDSLPGNPLHRECGVRNCAGTTTRHSETLRTITLPGTPRRRRCEHLFPSAKRPPFARSAWSQSFPFCSPTTLITRRWVAKGGPEGRSSKTAQKAGSDGRVSGTNKKVAYTQHHPAGETPAPQ